MTEVESFIDSLVAEKMAEYHVPGAIVVVIQDSQSVYKKAYGFADLENQIPVDVEKTGFRIASVTKTFTATAAMQLVEKGMLDLHVPISNYLPDRNFSFLNDEPITMHHLLTHTAGFDLTDIGDAALKAEDVVPLETFVRHHMPDRVHSPGEVHSYSNFGYTLAGYIIQVISGQSYEQYIKDNILIPLGMVHSSLDQPLPSPFKENLSKSYVWNKNRTVSIPRDFTNTVPGGGLVSTGGDMTRYMLYHLNAGDTSYKDFLGHDLHTMLTSQQYGSKGTQYGVAYAFFENGWTGRRCLEHTGAQLGFLSLMTLIPETGTGLFIAQNNREDAGGFRYDLARAIFDTLLHRNERHIDLPKPDESFVNIAKNYTGTYQQMNYPHSSYEKIGTLMGFADNAYNVKHSGGGFLQLNGDTFIMMDKELFHRYNEKSPWNVAFRLDQADRAYQLDAGILSYRKLSWFQHRQPVQVAAVLSVLMLLIHFIREIYLKIKTRSIERSAQYRTWMGPWLNAFCGLLFLGLAGVMTNFAIYQDQLSDYGVRFSFKVALLLITLGGILSLLSIPALLQLWKSETTGKRERIWQTAIIFCGIILTVIFWNHNLIGFNY